MTGTATTTEELKMTELGPLPNEWGVQSLRNLNREGRQTVNPANYPDEVFEYYSIPAYQDSGKPTLEKGKHIRSQKTVLGNGAILFGKLNPRVEKVWKVQSDSSYRKIGSTEWLVIFPDLSRVDSNYLYFCQWSPYVMQLAKTLVAGSTPSRQRVDPVSYYNLRIPLPPLPEQKKIAYVLSSVRTAIEKTEAVINAARELKESLMKHLFTYGPVSIDEAENVPLKETEIGMGPEGWELVRLEKVVTFSSKPRDFNLSARDKVPFVPMEYIPDERTDINRYQMKKPGEIGSGTFFFKGDLLVAKITPSFENGKQCIANNLPSDFAYATTEVWPLHETNKADLLYLFYYLKRKEVRANIAGKMEGSTGRQRVPRRVLQSLYIPLPPLPIQKQTAHILSLVDGKIEPEENKKQALEALFKTLLSNLMTGKIRVNSLEVPV